MLRIVNNQNSTCHFLMRKRVRDVCASLFLPPCFPVLPADVFGDIGFSGCIYTGAGTERAEFDVNRWFWL